MVKKFFFITVIFIFFIFLFNSGCSPQVVEQETAPADTVPPFITSIFLSPAVQVTGNFTVSVGAADNSAGVYRIYCELESPTNQSQGGSIGQKIPMYLTYNSSTKLWEKTVKLMPFDAELGDWMLNNITLQDKSGNIRRYERISEQSLTNYCDLKSTLSVITSFVYAEITVSAPPADNDAPDMLSISVDETDTSTTRDIEISIDATDDLSTVKRVICNVESPTEVNNPGTGGAVLDIMLNYNSILSLWQGNASFEYAAETGEWIINNIVIEDFAGNTQSFGRSSGSGNDNYYDINNSVLSSFKHVVINVLPAEDNSAPEMQDIYLYPAATTSTVRDITISIDADYDFSGISSMTCVVESPTEQLLGGGTHELVNVTLTYNSSDEIWEGTASIPAGAETGEWMINNIILEDNAGNSRLYERNTTESETHYYDNYTSNVSLFPFVYVTVVN